MSVLDYINCDVFAPVFQNKLPTFRSVNVDKICKELYYSLLDEEHIFIYGDYDMDGFAAAKVWGDTLSSLYNGKLTFFKYGKRQHSVDPAIIEQVKLSGARVVIICDSGSSFEDQKIESVLRASGCTVIVIDHHNWSGNYKEDSEKDLIFNAHEERAVLGGDEISGAYASLLVCKQLCETFYNRSVPYTAMVYALASMYSDVVDLATPAGRALYNSVSMIKMSGPKLMDAMNKWQYSYCRRFFSFIIAPKINACFRTESFDVLNAALSATDRYFVNSAAAGIVDHYEEASHLVNTMVKLFDETKFGEGLLLCVHDATDETRSLHIRNFSGLIANQIAQKNKCAVVAVINDHNHYEGSYRDFYNRDLLETFKLFCEADGHDCAFGVKFSNLNEVKRHLAVVSRAIPATSSKDYTVLSSSLVQTEEDVQALALYNEYMNVRPRILITHHCKYARVIRATKYRKFYDVGLPYELSTSSPILEGANILVEPTMSKAIELRCVE